MHIESWIQIAAICSLGAMSPGPSLAIVINNTVSRGRTYGIFTGLGHGIGIGIWALFTALGISKFITGDTSTSLVLQSLGSLLLAYVGYMTIRNREWNFNEESINQSNNSRSLIKGASEGFFISILNPKIALFFIAIFSHFVSTEYNRVEILTVALTAAIIDALWYSLVSILLTVSRISITIGKTGPNISLISGVFLIFVAFYLSTQILKQLIL